MRFCAEPRPSLTLSETLQPTPQLTLVSSPDASFNGPLKVLQDLGANDALEPENHDPILRQVITAGEAAIAVRLCVEVLLAEVMLMEVASSPNATSMPLS